MNADKREDIMVKRLYRVTAVFDPTFTIRRDYQSRAEAEHHVEVLRTPDLDGPTHPAVAPIVTITASDPITWPTT